jgi:hypothetical protein
MQRPGLLCETATPLGEARQNPRRKLPTSHGSLSNPEWRESEEALGKSFCASGYAASAGRCSSSAAAATVVTPTAAGSVRNKATGAGGEPPGDVISRAGRVGATTLTTSGRFASVRLSDS